MDKKINFGFLHFKQTENAIALYRTGKYISADHPVFYAEQPRNMGLFHLRTNENCYEGSALKFRELRNTGDELTLVFDTADGALTATVTVKPDETAELSYTVAASGALGAKIHGTSATVGGVLHTCPPIYIKNTLSEAEQAAILSAIEQLRSANPENLTDFALANAIYLAAGLKAPFADGADVRASLFVSTPVSGSEVAWSLSETSEYASMLVPTMYGGRRFFTPHQHSRTVFCALKQTILGHCSAALVQHADTAIDVLMYRHLRIR